MKIINESQCKRLEDLLNLIDAEESKDEYDDIDADAVLEYTTEVLGILRGIIG